MRYVHVDCPKFTILPANIECPQLFSMEYTTADALSLIIHKKGN